MNVRIGNGKLVHANPPRCKSTYQGKRHPTSKPLSCPGCISKAKR